MAAGDVYSTCSTMPTRKEEAVRLLNTRILDCDVIEYLDSGWTADVYRAMRREESVALKVYRSLDVLQLDDWMRIQRERHALQAVNHPNICRFIDAGHATAGGSERPALVMELIEGVSLQQHVDSSGPMDWPAFQAFAVPLLAGVSALHGQRLRHRDIKPANVRIEARTNRVVLVDFGLAIDTAVAESDALTKPHEFLGPIRYAAPEYIYRDPPESINNPAIDVYALGCTFYFMLTGIEPFADLDNRHAIAAAQSRIPLRFPEDQLPPTVRPILRSMVAKKSDLRPTAEDCRSVFAAAGLTVSAASPPRQTAGDRLRSIVVGNEQLRLATEAEESERRDHGRSRDLIRDIGSIAKSRIDRSALKELFGGVNEEGGIEITRFRNTDDLQRSFPDAEVGHGLQGQLIAVKPARGSGLIGVAYAIFVRVRGNHAECLRVVGTEMYPECYADIATAAWFTGTPEAVLTAAASDSPHAAELMVSLAADANERGHSRLPAEREAPPPLTVLGLSPGAARLAEVLVRASTTGTSTDPLLSPEQVRTLMKGTDHEIAEAVAELDARGWIKRNRGFSKTGFIAIWPEPELFVQADFTIMGWSVEDDARTIAKLIYTDGPLQSNALAERLAWPPRRINPALIFLEARGLISGGRSGGRTFQFFSIRKTDRTGSFVRDG